MITLVVSCHLVASSLTDDAESMNCKYDKPLELGLHALGFHAIGVYLHFYVSFMYSGFRFLSLEIHAHMLLVKCSFGI
jgi:hypothetical protein